MTGIIATAPRKTAVQRRSIATVEAILMGAAQVLERGDLPAFTTERVALRAGVSIGTLYQYFPNRDALITALLARSKTALANDVAAAIEGEGAGTLGAAVRRLIEAAVERQLAHPQLEHALDACELSIGDVTGSVDALLRLRLEQLLAPYARTNDRPLKGIAEDCIQIARGLIDAAGRRGEVDHAGVCARVEVTVSGYLQHCGFEIDC